MAEQRERGGKKRKRNVAVDILVLRRGARGRKDQAVRVSEIAKVLLVTMSDGL